MTTPADLIKEHNDLDTYCTTESKRFADHIKPARERMAAIEAQLHTLLLEQNGGKADGGSSIKTDAGTAYLSRILTPKILDKEAYLDWVLDNWSKWGSLLQILAPHKETLREYLDSTVDDNHPEGQPPPHVGVEWFVKCNIRRS